ncbi:centriolin [Sabethes cyaneus]|uniref:centriolin n=1 Tax=Sabethes cyaneus TaxID=53552 RepID=UPI00237DFA68|nr:centriolin [Sabethes cyaneus]
MSFSSQRTFLYVPFRNEQPQRPNRKRSDGALKNYESCTDWRAWTLDPLLASQFILDVVHKSRPWKLFSRPGGDYELTRDYLLQLDASELTDYVLSLMTELRAAKMDAKKLEDSRLELGQQLASVQKLAKTCEQEREELIVSQQQLAVKFDPEQHERELADLKAIICNLKCKAKKYDSLVEENRRLRKKLQPSSEENSLTAKKTVTEKGCGDSECINCCRLSAELCIYKNQYDDLKQQRRVLMEQVQKGKIAQEKVSELKLELDDERSKVKRIQQRLEDSLRLCHHENQLTIRLLLRVDGELAGRLTRTERTVSSEIYLDSAKDHFCQLIPQDEP